MTRRERYHRKSEVQLAEEVLDRRNRGLRGGYALRIAQERFGKDRFAQTVQDMEVNNG